MSRPADDLPIKGVAVDEWVFAAWAPDGTAGLMSGHRLLGRTAWYWAIHVREGYRTLHLAEWDVRVRPDPMVVKAPEMWAEHTCEEPLRQWTLGNEAFFTELDDPDDALDGAWGTPTPTAFDVEWYATGEPDPLDSTNALGVDGGFAQRGVAHGEVEVAGRSPFLLVEAPALRWRRWSQGHLAPLQFERGEGVLRAPMRFPGGAIRNIAIAPPGTTTTVDLGNTGLVSAGWVQLP